MSGYADVILPLRVAGDFSYSIPSDFSGKVSVGKRVIVPVGSKLYAGIVHKLHDSPPHGITLKDIQDVMDDHPVVLPEQIRLWEWIADYYQCELGEVYRAALPSGLKLESETEVAACEQQPDEALLAELTERGLSREQAEQRLERQTEQPGCSEHQLGLAVDIEEQGSEAEKAQQADTATLRWLREHSWRYGFILRYPENKTDITGKDYRPWHFRYVGREAAQQIHELDLSLEEYIEMFFAS